MILIKIFGFLLALLLLVMGAFGCLGNGYRHKKMTGPILTIIAGIIIIGILIFI